VIVVEVVHCEFRGYNFFQKLSTKRKEKENSFDEKGGFFFNELKTNKNQKLFLWIIWGKYMFSEGLPRHVKNIIHKLEGSV